MQSHGHSYRNKVNWNLDITHDVMVEKTGQVERRGRLARRDSLYRGQGREGGRKDYISLSSSSSCTFGLLKPITLA